MLGCCLGNDDGCYGCRRCRRYHLLLLLLLVLPRPVPLPPLVLPVHRLRCVHLVPFLLRQKMSCPVCFVAELFGFYVIHKKKHLSYFINMYIAE
jgi:hypothetical protein